MDKEELRDRLRKSPLNPEGQTCTKEGCGRPAVWGITAMDDQDVYDCEEHHEIGLLYGQLDWLAGERDYVIGGWIKQVQKTPDAAWNETGNLKNYLVLREDVSDDIDVPYKKQHEWVLGSLEAAIDTACELTQEKIDRKEAYLRNVTAAMEEYPGWDADDVGD